MLKRAFLFYVHGFKNMQSLGRKLWLIIFIKLCIMFLVLKLFFFPNVLKSNFSSDKERADHVTSNLTKQHTK